MSTPSLWSLTGFYDIERCGWWREMLEACGLQAAQLPVLSVAGQPAGGLRADAAEALGVQPGLPVAVGVLDHLAGAITAGNTKAGRASVSLGTAACAIVTHAERPEAMEGGVVGRHPADDKLWYALAWSGLSAGGVNWYAREKGGDHTLPSVLESAAGIARGADGWQAVPRDPNDGAAGFTFTQGHGYDGAGAAGIGPSDAQAVRAILECLAREIRGLLSRASCGRGIERVTAIGGGARSDVWLRVLADELGIPVDRPACVEASVRGASLLAERAAGGAGSQSSGMSHG